MGDGGRWADVALPRAAAFRRLLDHLVGLSLQRERELGNDMRLGALTQTPSDPPLP